MKKKYNRNIDPTSTDKIESGIILDVLKLEFGRVVYG